ncbi:PAS and ANTAR domain-containing protein [Nocardia sp. alder85J]|uniref:PAS and ANTAR domain-containing protein n=1 Tax=Nocardia sp. alder85J TaxID=2862949 RepID=UPI001CD619F1|nr:PAS and ANTAR domain-containing protein [Nocardia sp. alder85J]MCX4097036.1 PAS and ANTAR domain-containing protein [Nocardia sp. alder85J]
MMRASGGRVPAMTPDHISPGPADPGAGTALPGPVAGRFRFRFDTQQWEWSPEMFRMHGYPPDAVRPTTALLLSHRHPDDGDDVAAAITRSVTGGVPFSSRHRFLDTSGGIHTVMVVADRLTGDAGQIVGAEGVYIELDGMVADSARRMFDAQLPEIIRTRAEIEQAKGVLMAMYRIGAEQAFEVLRWRSQETNTRLQLLATRLLGDLPAVPAVPVEVISAFDHLLLTAHLRVPGADGEPPH